VRGVSIYTLNDLLQAAEAPCISIYQPTHRRHPENKQDPIRFKNLVTEVERSLKEQHPNRETRPLLAPLHLLAEDKEFWNHTQDGLAVFRTADSFRVYNLQRSVEPLAVVSDSFHIKPVVRYTQSADRYQVLCLSRDAVSMFEGNRDALDQIDLATGIPRNSTEAMSDDAASKTEKHVVNVSQGPAAGVRHGMSSGTELTTTKAERFFRAVDRGVTEQYSKPSKLPLILVALEDNQEIFRRVAHNHALLPHGVNIDPGSLSPERLRDDVWKVVLPYYEKRLADLVEAYGLARSKEHGSDDLSDIAQAAVATRVGTLLVEADKTIAGKLDPETGVIAFADLANPGVDDLVDDLMELVLRKGGDVVVVPADRMPTKTGVAATYRF
jgi:hypothetical protein